MTTLTTGTNFNNSAANGYLVADGFSGPAGAAATFPNGISGTTPIAGAVNATTLTVSTSAVINKAATFSLSGSSSGTTALAASAAASGVITFPAATDTVVLLGATQTLTAKTLTSPTITAPAITGAATIATGATITTPTINGPTIGGLPLFSAATPAAAGSTVTDATQLTAMLNAVTGANGTTGVKLPATPAAGTVVVIKNNAGSTLKVWPDAAATINAIAGNADLPVLTNAACLLFATSATQWWSVPLVPS